MVNYLKYKTWYTDINKKLKALYKSDYKLVAGLLASTSPRYSIKRNLNTTLKIYYDFKENKILFLLNAIFNKNNFLKEYKILNCHYYNIIRSLIHNYKYDLILSGQKVHAFYNNLIGNLDHVTIDTWILLFFRHKKAWINKSEYIKYSKYITSLAKKENLYPAELQAMIWIKTRLDHGFKPVTFTDFLK